MAQKIINARAKNKRDTSANWTAADPVLLDGEIIIVDTAEGEVRTKIGDGTKKYSQLPFEDEKLRSLLNNKLDKNGKVDWSNIKNAPTIPSNLNNVVTYDEGGTVDAADPIDADTLGGYSAAYFATKSAVDATNSSLSSLQTSVTNAESSITSLQESVASAQSDIGTLQTSAENLSSSKVDKAGGTMNGKLIAQNNADYTVKQMRNIFISTAAPTASDGANGDIWLKYEA